MRQTKHVTQKLTPACVPGQDGTGEETKKKTITNLTITRLKKVAPETKPNQKQNQTKR